MIGVLMRRDPAWKLALPLAAVVAAIELLAGPDIAILLSPLAYFFAFDIVRPHHRAMPFEIALPIAGRSLFLSRAASLLAMIWLQIAAACAVALLPARGEPAFAAAAPAFGFFFTFVVVYVLTVDIEECVTSPWLAFPAWGVATAASAVALAGPGWAAGVAVSGALGSIARFAWAWRRIPAAFQAAPYQPVVERSRRAPARPFTWRTPLVWNWFWGYVPFGAVAFLAALLAGQPLALTAFLVPAYVICRRMLRWLPGSGLPLSHRALAAFSLLPLVATVVLTYVPWAILQRAYDLRTIPAIRTEASAPHAYWKPVPGHAPEIRAPWGESVKPREIHRFGFSLYDPYTVGEQSSERFEEWQLDRATRIASIPTRLPAQILSFSLTIGFTLFVAWFVELGDIPPFNRVRRVVFETVTLILLVWTSPVLDVYGITHHFGSITEVFFKELPVTVCSRLPLIGVAAICLLGIAIPSLLLAERFPRREIAGPVRQDNGWDY